MATLLLLDHKNLPRDLKTFMLQNGTLTIAAGFTIGMASSNYMKSLVYNFVFPSLYRVVAFFSKSPKLMRKLTSNHTEVSWINVLKDTLVWIFIVLFAFLVLNSVRKGLLKLPDSQAPQQEQA